MAEPNDAVLRILQKIQATQSEHSAKLNELGEKFDGLSGYITYQMGVTTRNGVDIEDIQKQIKDLSQRVTALEAGH
jgi:GTP cyclohydrolase III